MRTSIIALLLGVIGACGDDTSTADPYKCVAAGGDACFELPTARVEAADPVSFASKAPILNCAPYEVTMSAAPVTLTGLTVTLYGGNAIGAVRFEVFANPNLAGSLSDVTSDDGSMNPDLTGSYMTTIDVLPSLVHLRTSKAGFLPLVFLDHRIDVTQPQLDMYDVDVATRLDISTLLESVGDSFLMSKTQLIGHALDCAGNNLVNVVANIATTSARDASRSYEPSVRTYYAMDGKELRLGRRTMLMQTTTSGQFAASNLGTGRHYVQLWGYLTDSDVAKGNTGLTLLAEQEVLATSIEAALFVPLYGHE